MQSSIHVCAFMLTCIFVPHKLVWLVVFVGTLLLGVDLGFAVGIGFSLLVVVFKVAL